MRECASVCEVSFLLFTGIYLTCQCCGVNVWFNEEVSIVLNGHPVRRVGRPKTPLEAAL